MPVTGPLQMIQALANTLGGSPGADQLGTREEAAAWLRIKSCSAAHCGQAFYDESGSAAARLCSAHASSP